MNAKDSNHDTALMKAVFAGHLEIVKLLLAGGAKSSQRNLGNKTAAMLAEEIGQTRIARMLAEAESTQS